MQSRRKFLKASGLALTGGIILASGSEALGQIISGDSGIPKSVYNDRITSLGQKHFEQVVDSVFQMSRDGLPTTNLKLVEVEPPDFKKPYLSDRPVEMFTLIFEGNGKTALGDGLYLVNHPELGEFTMFISTVGRSGRRYQANVSRVYF